MASSNLETVQNVYDRALSEIHLRGTTPRWLKLPDEILEVAYDGQIEMLAREIPERLLGELHELKNYEPNLGNTKFTGVKVFDLPDDCLRVMGIAIQFTTYNDCEIRYAGDIDVNELANTYMTPTEEEPIAYIVGRKVYLTPIATATTHKSMVINMVAIPEELTATSDPVQVSLELRLCLVSYMAWKLAAKREKSKRMELKSDFEQRWAEITGSSWNRKGENVEHKTAEV